MTGTTSDAAPRLETPRLETPRLLLRGHCLQDFEAFFALWSDPTVICHIQPRPTTRAEAWSRLMRQMGHWPLLGFGYWAIEEKASGRFAGEVGFADFMRDTTPSIHGLAEMGWVVQPWAQGKGVATEAVQCALRWARDALSRPIVCLIAPENTASLRVAEKVGFRAPERVRFGDAWTTLLRQASP